MSLRDEVEKRLPNWASWYPSVFDAARDLGLIRARVCAPSSLLLSNRLAGVQAFLAHQRGDHFVQLVASNYLVQRIQRQADPVIGDAVLGIIVGSDLLGPIA